MELGNLKIFEKKGKYNKRVLSFFLNLTLVGTIWFFCYHLLLKPTRLIDKPLTHFLTESVAGVINIITPSSGSQITAYASNHKACSYLVKDKLAVFSIWDVCNGIDLMYIYIAIIILLPFSAKRKLFFSLAGILAIILANIVRITSLYYIYVHFRTAFDFSHHYVFTILMYLLIFYGWLLFTKKQHLNEAGS
jgi:exosortase/archaeosortase family protein